MIELHCYAVPDAAAESETAGVLLEELRQLLPELKEAQVRHQHLQVRGDFTAFHVGMHAHRPETATGIPGLVLAGDWVKLPFPAMLMEAAFASGLLAANHLLSEDGLREEPVESVPLRGALAGLPASPARRRLVSELRQGSHPPEAGAATGGVAAGG